MREVLEAKTLYREFEDMATRCMSTKLVDCYLTWARLRGFDAALFVVSDCLDAGELATVEAEMIDHHAATDMRHGLNCRQGSKR